MKAQKNIVMDTLEYAKLLEKGGVKKDDAEAHANALATVMANNLATKQDIYISSQNLRGEMQEMKHELKIDIKNFDKSLTLLMYKLTVGSFLGLSTVIALMHFLFK